MLIPFNIKSLPETYFITILCLASFFGSNWTIAQPSKLDSLKLKFEEFQSKPNFEKDTLYIDHLYELGREISYYNLDSLLIIANKTISLSEKTGYPGGEIKGLLLLGSYHSENGAKDQAIEIFTRAHSAAISIENVDLLLKSKNLLAIEYEYREDHANALKLYLEGIAIAKKKNDLNHLVIFYVNTSNLYGIQKEYAQTIFFLRKAKKLNEKSKDSNIKAVTLANLAATYIETEDLKNASENVDQSIAIFEKLNTQEWLTYAYELKAQILLKQKAFDLALSWFQKSEKIHEAIDQTRYKIPLYNGIAKTYLELQNYSSAEMYAHKALTIAKSLNNLEGKEDSNHILYQIKKNTGDAANALIYLETLKNISDTINKNKNEKELRILKSNLKFKQEKERYILENEKKINTQKSYFYGALIIILACSIIIIILKRNSKIQDDLNEKLTLKTIELEKNQNHLKISNNTKSKLFSIIGHDLKGPINSFKSLFGLVLSREIGPNDFLKFAPTLNDQLHNISFTLNNLLSWGQTQMNGMRTNAEITELHTLVNENFSLLSKIADQKSIKLINRTDPDTQVWCDENQINIVIRNLLSNAIKFTREKGTVTFGAQNKEDYWQIYVQDTGIGLTEDALQKVFKTQETFTTFGTNNEQGTGLGLLLCQEMVLKNDGAIWVESTLNKGTCFYFTLPKPKK